ncbi:MAG TPA: hypothetical protein VLK33_13835 [Terriglobales bacterium]|nr:hypothetical protein [Terriglobales bacterium]
MKPKVLLSWSSGKDSAWALHVLRQKDEVEVVGLLTTINEQFQRVAMHSTRQELVRAQAKAVGLPLWEIPLPWPCSNEQYEFAMMQACSQAVEKGITGMAFGDLFLEDVRKYREDRLKSTGLQPIFPVWGCDTKDLIEEMLDAGLRARIVCLDPRKLPEHFAGQDISRELLAQFPAGIDPCGENGEFHTFVHAGPMFSNPIPIQSGEVVARDGFIFADVLLSSREYEDQLAHLSQTLP